MKKYYSSPSMEVYNVSLEAGACVIASVPENEAFNPVPGLWN